MAYDVGVLISRQIFGDCAKGSSLYESFDLYESSGNREGFQPVFFTLNDISYQDLTVRGIVRDASGRYERRRIPLPSLIHNRVKPMFRDSRELCRLRSQPDTTLFNLDNRLDKWKVYQILNREPALAGYLPETAQATPVALADLFRRHGSLYLKPSDKSLGMGIRRLNRDGETVHVSASDRRTATELSHGRLAEKLVQWTRGGNFLLQQGIELICCQGRPVDIRVSVQRGKSGAWQVSGMVARVGPEGAVATNVAVGGRARLLDPVLRQAGVDPEPVRTEIGRVAVLVAQVLSRTCHGMADLGLDMGLDPWGRVWIIEVNGRDLRITFHQARDWEAWVHTFCRPMEYAAFLLRNRKAEGPRIAWLTPGTLSLTGKMSGSVETAVRETAGRLGKTLPVYVIGNGLGGVPSIRPVHIGVKDRRAYRMQALAHLRRLQPKVIQVENRPAFVREARQACPEANIILYAHSTRFFQPPAIGGEPLERALSLCDRVLTNSAFLRERLLQRVPAAASMMEVLPLGVDTDRFRSREDPVVQETGRRERRRWGLEAKKVLLFLGRFIPQKGLHHLLAAFPAIRESHPDVRLLVVGGTHYGKTAATPYVRRLRRMARTMGEGVTWVPFVPHHRVPAFLAAADLLVTPSMGEEAFGLVNLEAMATGLPVVSVRTGGIPEVVEDGVTGVLIPGQNPVPELASTCRSLLADPDRLRELGRNGRERVEARFTWDRTAQRFRDLYTRLGIL